MGVQPGRVVFQKSLNIYVSDGTAVGTKILGPFTERSYVLGTRTPDNWFVRSAAHGWQLPLTGPEVTVASYPLNSNAPSTAWDLDGNGKGYQIHSTTFYRSTGPSPADWFPVIVRHPESQIAGSGISTMAALEGQVYFSNTSGLNAGQLWRTEGTEAGTELVLLDPMPSKINRITRVGARLFFTSFNEPERAAASGFISGVWTCVNGSQPTLLLKDARLAL